MARKDFVMMEGACLWSAEMNVPGKIQESKKKKEEEKEGEEKKEEEKEEEEKKKEQIHPNSKPMIHLK